VSAPDTVTHEMVDDLEDLVGRGLHRMQEQVARIEALVVQVEERVAQLTAPTSDPVTPDGPVAQ
jgi:hypothetical protein